jgi:FxsC-like protein
MQPGGWVSGDQVPVTQGAAPYFFLSYAHTPKHDPTDPDDPDAWVWTLYTDLCRHIMALTDLPNGARPGFMDRELRLGNIWPAALSDALATCRVFVPLYSHRYFESEQCGREWYAFSRRVLDAETKAARRAEAIIPAIWVPVDVDGMQVAREEPLPPGKLADYTTLESAFSLVQARDRGARRLRLTVVAPTSSELPPGRGDFHYGRSALDWNPYRPDSIRPLAEHASELVKNLDYQPDIGDLDEHCDALTGNGPPAAPEVVLVDAWATGQPECAQTLRRFDSMNKPWIQVVVPWNRADPETAAAEAGLRDSLDKSLRNKLAEGRATSLMAVRGVPCLEDFNAVLPALVRTAVRQYLKYAEAHPPAGPAMEKPRLLRPTIDPEHDDD